MPVTDFTPTSAQVAALMFSRVAGEHGIVAEFTASTRPTVDQVDAMIPLAVATVSTRVGVDLDPRFQPAAAFMAMLYTALLLEPGYWAEQQRPDKSAWEEWKKLYDDGMEALVNALSGGSGDPDDPGSTVIVIPSAVWSFPPICNDWPAGAERPWSPDGELCCE